MYSNTKVAAYCRVSTDTYDQKNSLSSQRSYFNEYINDHDEWELVEIYYDEGITGTSTKHREGFNRMIADCEAGKIQLVLTKEVSRFARNTIDTLTYTRKLSDLGIGVIFMNDGIDTRDKDGELRLSIMATLAQEESRKISERVKWGIKRQMENGVVFGCSRIYGFRVTEGKLVIVPEEAEVVKEIFREYLYEGKGSTRIARELTDRGVPTINNGIWNSRHIIKMLHNEKYVGDLTQWKIYKPNVLSDKRKINKGDGPDSPLITIKDHHEGIISREVWDAVQEELARRTQLSKEGSKHSRSYWFSGKCRCGKCGYSYLSRGSRSDPHTVLGCRNRQLYGTEKRTALNGKPIGCDNRTVDERILSVVMKYLMQYVYRYKADIENEIINEIGSISENIIPADANAVKVEIDNLKAKRLKAVDLMLEGLISKDALKEQSEYYDSEIARLTEKMTLTQDIASKRRKQAETVHKAVERIRSLSEDDIESEEVYCEMVQEIIFPEYTVMNVYLKGIPAGFHINYSVKKDNVMHLYEISVDSCEMIEG